MTSSFVTAATGLSARGGAYAERMLQSLHVRGYRSLQEVHLPLKPLSVVTGPNGAGKSNLYRCLHLLARAAQGELSRALVEEGGMPSVLWSGPRRRRGLGQAARAEFSIEIRADSFGYAFTCGLPIPQITMFQRDPEVKRERGWLGATERPATRFLERDHASARVRSEDGTWVDFAAAMEPGELAFAQIQEPRRFPDLDVVRTPLRRWRFYHHIRTDPEAPARQPRQGTRTTSLSSDGSDLAASLQTVRELGDAAQLAAAVNRLQPGARLEIVSEQGWFDLRLHLPGLLRPLTGREISDGTLRYLALVAALLSPRPAPLLAFNEPESSLHPDLLPSLAQLFVSAATRTQIWVTTHAPALARALADASGVAPVELTMKDGATTIVGQGLIWNAEATEDEDGDD